MSEEQTPLFHRDRARTVIAGLGRAAFAQFIDGLLSESYTFERIPDLGPLPCFIRLIYNPHNPILFGLSYDELGPPYGLYMVDHLPFHILTNPGREAFRSPDFIATVQEMQLKRWAESFNLPYDRNGISNESRWRDYGIFILNNSVFLEPGRLRIALMEYDNILSAYGLPLRMVGNVDSIAEHDSTIPFLESFLQDYGDGLSVSLSQDGPRVHPFIAQSYLAAGSGTQKSGPLEPMLVRSLRKQQLIIQEFEKLLASMPTEGQLEDFLRAYYREVFGFRYDRITTQLWLKLPSADISKKNRRLDLFLRNAVTSDWELFELKRSNVPLTGSYRDIPTLAKTVHDGVLQIENYLRLLAQDQVRRKLNLEGIDYLEPTAHLVIGRRPSMKMDEWRWLLGTNRSGVNIVTYDDLLNEMKARLLPFQESGNEER